MAAGGLLLWVPRTLFGVFGRTTTTGAHPKHYIAGEPALSGEGPGSTPMEFAEWFKEQTVLASSRVGRYREYMNMDEDIIASALDLLAEEATPLDYATGRTIWPLTVDDQVKEILEQTFLNCEIDDRAFAIARCLAKFGDRFDAIVTERDDNGLPKRIIKLRAMSPLEISREEDALGNLQGFRKGHADEIKADIGSYPLMDDSISQPWDFLHCRLSDDSSGDEIYGTSLISPVRRIWRYLKLMEESLAIYRIRRAPDRLMWEIMVPEGTPPEEAQQILSEVRQRTKKKMQVNPDTGQVISEMDPWAMDEDIFIAKTPSGGSTVSVLSGVKDVGDVLDIDYMRKRLFSCLRIPPDYMGFADAGGTLSGRAPLSDQDVRFAKSIKRLQKGIMVGVALLCKLDMIFRGLDVTTEKNQFTINMHPVSFLDEFQQAETAKVRAEIVTQLLPLGPELNLNQEEWVRYVASISGFPEEVLGRVLKPAETAVAKGEVGRAKQILSEALKDHMQTMLATHGLRSERTATLHSEAVPVFTTPYGNDKGDSSRRITDRQKLTEAAVEYENWRGKVLGESQGIDDNDG